MKMTINIYHDDGLIDDCPAILGPDQDEILEVLRAAAESESESEEVAR